MHQTEKSRTEPYSHPKIEPQEFKKEDYIHLWQYFSDRADMLKDRLWTMATWLFGLNSAILGFIFGTPLIAFDSAVSTVRAPAFVLALALAGCVLCLYAFVLIDDYGLHIQRNWDRTYILKEKLPLIKDALEGKSSTKGESRETLANNTSVAAETEDGEKEEQQKTAPKLQDKLPHKVIQIVGLPPIAKNLIVFTLLYLVTFLTISAFAFQRLQ